MLKEEEKVRDPLNTVDRLLRCKMEANERLNGLRQKQIQDQMAQVKDRPTITEYELKDQRVPVHLRETQGKSYDQMVKDMRESNPDRFINQFQECTFSPVINQGRSG